MFQSSIYGLVLRVSLSVFYVQVTNIAVSGSFRASPKVMGKKEKDREITEVVKVANL